MKPVSKAALGQLRPPSQADIQRRLTSVIRSPAQTQAHRQAMARLEKAAMQFVAMQQGRQPPLQQQPKTSVRLPDPVRATPRHNSVAQASYGDKAAKGYLGRARTPEHVAIQRTVQRHIQRNLQRDARNERFRQMERQIKANAVAMVRQVGRTTRSMAQSMPQPAPGRVQTVQSELAARQKMQSMTRHREKTQDRQVGKEKSRGKEPVVQRTPVRQQQQQQGKERDRGRER